MTTPVPPSVPDNGYGPLTGDDFFKRAEAFKKQGNRTEAEKNYAQAAHAYENCGDKAKAEEARNKAKSL